MSYELLIERNAEKDLKKLEDSVFRKIVAKIKKLAANPHPRDGKKIAGSQNDWRIRIGDYIFGGDIRTYYVYKQVICSLWA